MKKIFILATFFLSACSSVEKREDSYIQSSVWKCGDKIYYYDISIRSDFGSNPNSLTLILNEKKHDASFLKERVEIDTSRCSKEFVQQKN